ncbi:MAG: endonuclease/exonuclease/phosphatase family protein [Chloroflexota bacterium]
MPQTIRVASFNAENLFSRARVLNLPDDAEISAELEKIRQLDKLLRQSAYAPDDKQEIIRLYGQLLEFIEIRENRGRLFSNRQFNPQTTRVVADGAAEWDGEIEFKRADFSEVTRENTARVLREIKPNIVCMVEVENRTSLLAFNRALLGNRKLKFGISIDGNDDRGIDVGMLTNFPVVNLKTHVYDGTAVSPTFSRDCLEVAMKLPDGRLIHLLCNHFKSKSGGDAATDPKRKKQAERVKEILSGYDLANDLVIVAGDLNDFPHRPPLQPLLGLPHLHDVLALQFPNDPAARWTHKFGNEVSQLDYVLISEPLKEAFVKANVERRGIFGLSRVTAGAMTEFPTVTSEANSASDHGAVWAELSV